MACLGKQQFNRQLAFLDQQKLLLSLFCSNNKTKRCDINVSQALVRTLMAPALMMDKPYVG